MNKGDLVDSVAERLGVTKAVAGRMVDAVIASIADGVQSSGKVTIAGFGTFRKKQRAQRTGINPATRETIVIRPCTTVGFTPSRALKDSME